MSKPSNEYSRAELLEKQAYERAGYRRRHDNASPEQLKRWSEEGRDRMRLWRAGLTKQQKRDISLRQRFGITQADYDNMKKQQASKCLLCDRSECELVIDHDHDTGIIRGLLCRHCNSMLGWYQRKAERIEAYLSV